jgi:lipid-A-disaccharide synthase
VLAKLPKLFDTRRTLVAAARAERPDALVVVDFPDFNLRLAREVKRLGIPVVYYISPQIWAWRAGRLATIRAIADRVLVIFPFEEKIYRDGGVPVEFVGHPLVDLTSFSPRAGSRRRRRPSPSCRAAGRMKCRAFFRISSHRRR